MKSIQIHSKQKLQHRSNLAPINFFNQEKRRQHLVLSLRKTAVQMSHSVLLTRARARLAGANDPQPKASASLNDEHRFARLFPLGLHQRQAELVCHLRTSRSRSQPVQHRVHLSDRQKVGCLRLRDKDHSVLACHLHQKIFNRSKQRREREGQTDTSVS